VAATNAGPGRPGRAPTGGRSGQAGGEAADLDGGQGGAKLPIERGERFGEEPEREAAAGADEHQVDVEFGIDLRRPSTGAIG
jgi:hypothetical protein